ncbi:MAG: LLM class flavin-dependent oxidoreductase [Actinobacteria bacterium]|nr:LLM class flavin-dependent oxidoreductase [Actinomycetota bacterium]
MRVGVCILPEDRWPVAAEKWRQAEALGFAHAWTYDHLNWRDLRDGPWFSAIPTLTGAATVTTAMRLGTLVASPNFRHPVSFAREVITLDDVSAGRFTLGFGAGGDGWDATVLGQDPWSPKERSARFSEFVEILDRLLREPELTVEGDFYAANDARTHPGCVQYPRVPFAIAAVGPNAMRIAAKFGTTWVTTGPRDYGGQPLGATAGAAAVAKQMARLDEACAAQDRDPSTIERLVLTGLQLDGGLRSADEFDEVKGAYAAVGVTDLVVHWPRSTEPYKGDPELLGRIDI